MEFMAGRDNLVVRRRARMAMRQGLQVAIVGPGRLGQAMGKLLLEAGVPISFVAARRLERAKSAVRFIGGGKPLRLASRRMGEADIILITTSDAAVKSVAEKIAASREDWSKRVVLHTCGSLPASLLSPFRERGAAIGSLHPYQTVPNPAAGVRNLRGCFWAIEGDAQSLRLARQWVKKLNGIAFTVPPEAKPLYHLSAFLVCPTVVTLMEKSAKLLRRAGVPRQIIQPMLEKFVSETAINFAEYGARKALTGPAVRGDWETLEKHVAELQRVSPEVIPVYRELVRLMLELAGVKLEKRKVKRKTTTAKSMALEQPHEFIEIARTHS